MFNNFYDREGDENDDDDDDEEYLIDNNKCTCTIVQTRYRQPACFSVYCTYQTQTFTANRYIVVHIVELVSYRLIQLV